MTSSCPRARGRAAALAGLLFLLLALISLPAAAQRGKPLPTASLSLQLLTPIVTEGEAIELDAVITAPCPLESNGVRGFVVANYEFVNLSSEDLGGVTVTDAIALPGFPSGQVEGFYAVMDPTNDVGATEVRMRIRIETLDDGETEPDERASFDLDITVSPPIRTGSRGKGPHISCQDEQLFFFDSNTSNSVEVTVVDREVPTPIYELSVTDAEPVIEGDSGRSYAEFTIFSEPPVGIEDQIPVSYRMGRGTATAGEDFDDIQGSITLTADQASPTILVGVLGDTLVEEDETIFFIIETSSPIATIRKGVGEGLIIDDDDDAEPLRVEAAPVTLPEGDSGTTSFDFQVRVLPAPPSSGDPIVIAWETRDGSATAAADDYLPGSGSLTFAPGGPATQVVSVQVLGDLEVEPDEEFFVDFELVSGDAVVTTPSTTGTILNDDEESFVSFAAARFMSGEDGTAMIAVRRSGSERGAVEVTARTTQNGTATPGEDFVPSSARLSWPPGDSSTRFLEVEILPDSVREEDETVVLVLLDPVGASLAAPDRARLVIVDDDVPRNLEIVGEGEPTAQVGERIRLGVVVSEEGGGPVAGVTVLWTVTEGEGELIDGDSSITNEEGEAAKEVVVGPLPQLLRVLARAAGQERTFLISVNGLVTLFSDPNSSEASMAGVLDEACRRRVEALREVCDYLLGLAPDDQRRAIEELTPEEVATLGVHALNLQQVHLRTLKERLAAVRRGVRVQVDQVALGIRGHELNPQQLTGAFAKRPSQIERLAERIDEILTTSTGSAPAGGDPGPQVEATDEERDPLAQELAYSERWGLFVSGRYTLADRRASERQPGFDSDNWGLTVGADYWLNKSFLTGGAFSYTSTSGNLAQQGGDIDAPGYTLAWYSMYSTQKLYVDLMASYGRNDYELRRFVDLPQPFVSSDPTLDGRQRFVAVGRPDGDQRSLGAGFGYDLLTGAVNLSGFVRGSWLDSSIDAYAESGAGPFALEILDQDLESLQAEGGFHLTVTRSFSWGVLQPALRASYLRELEDDARLILGRLVADPGAGIFVVPTDRPDRQFFNISIGAAATFPGGHNVFLNYDTDLSRDDVETETFAGGFRLVF